MKKALSSLFLLAASLLLLAQNGAVPIPVGGDRECFFDEYLLDMGRTTAGLRLHRPVYKGTVMVHDAPWEGSGCDLHNFFFDDQFAGVDGSHPEGVYRMYHLGWKIGSGAKGSKGSKTLVVCYAESPDGITWTKPDLGLQAFEGDTHNNIVVAYPLHPGNGFTPNGQGKYVPNFMVFRDDNPACLPEEKYKGITLAGKELRYFISTDGLHWAEGGVITDKGRFDTLDIAFWDERAGLYRCYIRTYHDTKDPRVVNPVRTVSYLESKDFRTWTEPVDITFDDGEEIPLYTNCMSNYFRAPQLCIGFPSRYVERTKWTGNYDELGGLQHRKDRFAIGARYGLAVTDCNFVVSRDGKHFHRFWEAFMTPGPELDTNWVYGDCFLARGFAITPNDIPGAPDELSLYVSVNHWMDEPAKLNRYTIRMDGFASLHADGKEVQAVTKPFTYTGGELHINFETSAMGYVYVTLIDAKGNRFPACETFGNAIDRKVVFDDPEAVAANAGKPVTLEFRLRDADIYSMQFR